MTHRKESSAQDQPGTGMPGFNNVRFYLWERKTATDPTGDFFSVDWEKDYDTLEKAQNSGKMNQLIDLRFGGQKRNGFYLYNRVATSLQNSDEYITKQVGFEINGCPGMVGDQFIADIWCFMPRFIADKDNTIAIAELWRYYQAMSGVSNEKGDYAFKNGMLSEWATTGGGWWVNQKYGTTFINERDLADRLGLAELADAGFEKPTQVNFELEFEYEKAGYDYQWENFRLIEIGQMGPVMGADWFNSDEPRSGLWASELESETWPLTDSKKYESLTDINEKKKVGPGYNGLKQWNAIGSKLNPRKLSVSNDNVCWVENRKQTVNPDGTYEKYGNRLLISHDHPASYYALLYLSNDVDYAPSPGYNVYFWPDPTPTTTPTPGPTLYVPLRGDADGDGLVNLFDILAVRDHIFNIQMLFGNDFNNADMDNNKMLNIYDIMGIVDIILKRF